jgi:hypothetical protein
MSCKLACTISWQENVCGCVYFIHVWYIRKLCLTKLENLTIYSHTYPNSHLELLLPGVDGQFKTLPTGFMFYFSSYVTVENVKQCNLCTSICGRLLHKTTKNNVMTFVTLFWEIEKKYFYLWLIDWLIVVYCQLW